MSKTILQQLLDSGNYITVNRKMIKILGLYGAVLLGELISQYNYYQNRNELTDKDEFFCIREKLMNNTGLLENQIKTCVAVLWNVKIIDVTKKGMPARFYYKLNFDEIEQIFYSDSSQWSKKLTTSGQKSLSLVVKKFNHYLYNKNINNKNKEIKRSFQKENSNNASKDALSNKSKIKNSLKNRIKNNTSNSKELQYDKAKKITKTSMDLFFKYAKIKSPKIHKDKFYSSKEVYLCENLINKFIKGFSNNNYTSLKNWINKQKNKDELNNTLKKGMSSETFLNKLELACNCYSSNYFPDDKKYLSNRLSGFLYNAGARVINSYFLLYGFNPPKEKSNGNIAPQKQLFQGGYDIIKDCFEEIHKTALNKNQVVKLSKICNLICKEYDKQFDLIYQAARNCMDLYCVIGTKKEKGMFFETYSEWIKNRTSFIELNFGGEVQIDMIKPGTKTWNSFCDYLNEKYSISFYPDEKLLKEKQEANIIKYVKDIHTMPWETGSEFELDYNSLDISDKIKCRKLFKNNFNKIKIEEFFGKKLQQETIIN